MWAGPSIIDTNYSFWRVKGGKLEPIPAAIRQDTGVSSLSQGRHTKPTTLTFAPWIIQSLQLTWPQSACLLDCSRKLEKPTQTEYANSKNKIQTGNLALNNNGKTLVEMSKTCSNSLLHLLHNFPQKLQRECYCTTLSVEPLTISKKWYSQNPPPPPTSTSISTCTTPQNLSNCRDRKVEWSSLVIKMLEGSMGISLSGEKYLP